MSPDEKLRLLRADVDALAQADVTTRLEALPDWGSLAILLVILHLEEKHRLTVSGARIRECRTVAEILALIP